MPVPISKLTVGNRPTLRKQIVELLKKSGKAWSVDELVKHFKRSGNSIRDALKSLRSKKLVAWGYYERKLYYYFPTKKKSMTKAKKKK